MNVPTIESSTPYNLAAITAAPVAAVHRGQCAETGLIKSKEQYVESYDWSE